jgi:SAM-dependent methyltransferase
MTLTAQQCVELLPVTLLDDNRAIVNELKILARSLRLEFGWHYLLDLTWILSRLGQVNGKRIMDAGAGTGILQWYLAEHGAEVFSVDRMDRAGLALRFRRRFNVHGVRPGDLASNANAFAHSFRRPARGAFYRRWAARLVGQGRDVLAYALAEPVPGRVWFYHQDLVNLVDIPNESLDAVVSVSALEHNTPEGLQSVVQEIMRKLKPGGVLLATLTAGKGEDRWHEASAGWCYTDTTLRRLFDLPEQTPSNYARYDALMDDLRGCAELRDNLAKFYFNSPDKGMPDGVWNPQYQPVGVCKIKPAG